MGIIDYFFGKGHQDGSSYGKQQEVSAFSSLRAVAKKQAAISFGQNFVSDIQTNQVQNRDEILNRRKNQRIEEYERALGDAEKRWRARYEHLRANPAPPPYAKALLMRFANSELFISRIKDILKAHKGRHISQYRTAQDWVKAVMGELQVPERDLAFQCDKAIEDLK